MLDSQVLLGLTRVQQMPTTGQFVAVWVYEGRLWSDTFMYREGVLYVSNHNSWSDDEDDWVDPGLHPARDAGNFYIV